MLLPTSASFWDFAPSPRRPIDPVSRQIARTNQVAHPISLQVASPTTPDPFHRPSFSVTNPLECAGGKYPIQNDISDDVISRWLKPG